jgi:hypothetical protein
MKWNEKLKALIAAEQGKELCVQEIDTDENCQKPLTSAFDGSDSRQSCESSSTDFQILREERKAILIFDGGMTEVEAESML